jgi:RNA polymerase sigma-70 factor (ECF subfamily)
MSPALNHSYGPAHRDSDLVLAALSGSISAFEELQRQYSPIIHRKILSITRNREDAEDVLQDAFLRAYLNLQTFEGRSAFKTWLTQIAINSALMLVRKRRVQAKLFVERTAPSEDDDSFVDLRDSSLNPEQTYDQRQRLDNISHAVQKLKPDLRCALEIWISQGCSMKEISNALGISLSSVKARLHRARKRLLTSPALRKHGLTGFGALPLQNREAPCMNCE